MRRVILMAALMMSGAAVAADVNAFPVHTTADLVRACTVAPDDPLHSNAMGLCQGVLIGAYGYYDSTVAVEDRFVCSPVPTPKAAEVMNGFVAWAKSHSQYTNDDAIDTLFRFLSQTYPCAK